jgi:S-adenosylmethionine:tRNA ribosyltransferase-isomerase
VKTRDFFFELPPELIAQTPPAERGQSRLLVYERATGRISHARVRDLARWIDPGTVMVFNNTRVRKARLLGQSPTGGAYEALLLEADRADPSRWHCMVKKAARLKPGFRLLFPEDLEAVVEGGDEAYRWLRFARAVDDAYLDRAGHVPLPPYIRRADQAADAERYQTVYAGPTGSVAAPTAGLHFTPELLAALDARGAERRELTLHVGLGTFLPVRAENLDEHVMHREHFAVPPETAAAVDAAKTTGRPVLAVGTTSLRTLESAAETAVGGPARLRSGEGSTDIFIRPGYRFRLVDRLFTNFHTPESTLLMLVSAFAGCDEIKRVYEEAVRERYRFFSYGDAMLIL